jgi:hypothetical protein
MSIRGKKRELAREGQRDGMRSRGVEREADNDRER